MSHSKKKPNSLNRAGIQRIKDQIVAAWPWASVQKGFYIEDPTPLGISGSAAFKEVAAGVSGNSRRHCEPASVQDARSGRQARL
jgi:hypothetical protein